MQSFDLQVSGLHWLQADQAHLPKNQMKCWVKKISNASEQTLISKVTLNPLLEVLKHWSCFPSWVSRKFRWPWWEKLQKKIANLWRPGGCWSWRWAQPLGFCHLLSWGWRFAAPSTGRHFCDQLWSTVDFLLHFWADKWTSGSTGGPVGNFSPKIRYLSRLTSEALVGFCILSLIKQLRQGKLTMARSTMSHHHKKQSALRHTGKDLFERFHLRLTSSPFCNAGREWRNRCPPVTRKILQRI